MHIGHSALKLERQLSAIKWIFNSYGPFVHDIEITIQENTDIFDVKHTTNYLGGNKTIFSLKKCIYVPTLNNEDIEILNRVIEVTKDKTWDQFITFVYSTYPIINSSRYSSLNLVELATEYKKLKMKK